MSQNALCYTFSNKGMLIAIRKLCISFLVVENKFGCKDGKVKEYEYEHCHQQILKNCSSILTNL